MAHRPDAKRSVPPRMASARNSVADLRQPVDPIANRPIASRRKLGIHVPVEVDEPVEERGGELGPEHSYSADQHGENDELRQPH